MLHKILLFNLKDTKDEGLVRDKTMELLAQVPGVVDVSFRNAIGEGEHRYQYLITVDFASMNDHEQYMVHERHVEFSKQYFRPYISEVFIQFFE